MTVYAVVQLEINDRTSYDQYQAKFWPVFKKFKGRLLVSDEDPKVLEGQWTKDKIVVISFPDEQSFVDWSTSPEYLEIAEHRYAGATATLILAKEFSLQ
ncbi:MAG: DUF1330 domain-containing protein [Acidiferrobacterales bacterium]|nr:DUF1330 domain-containing protein [Acidiferrobacterales bacterium]